MYPHTGFVHILTIYLKQNLVRYHILQEPSLVAPG